MTPNKQYITIGNNLELIKEFIDKVIIEPKHTLSKWAKITGQTPAAKVGYIGQHLSSLITGVAGTRSGARGDDLADGSEVKSCNKIDQVDKCKDCGARVMRIEPKCPECGSLNIVRKKDSKWLFSIRDNNELDQYKRLERLVLLLMDYPNFAVDDFKDIRIMAFEIYPKEERMKVFTDLITNHYQNIFLPKQKANAKTNPMNLHPWSFQFYKCNPIKTFECIVKDVDTAPSIQIVTYLEPNADRDDALAPMPMPSSLLYSDEWTEMLSKADFTTEIAPLLAQQYTKAQFEQLTEADKSASLPFLDQKLRDYIPLRPITPSRQKRQYQRHKP